MILLNETTKGCGDVISKHVPAVWKHFRHCLAGDSRVHSAFETKKAQTVDSAQAFFLKVKGFFAKNERLSGKT